jgi:MerR family transcriptional regulator, light-induced transcriptional regulator
MQTIDLDNYSCYNIEAKRHEKIATRYWKIVGERFIMREKHTEGPDLEHYSDAPLYNMKAVAQQTGIAAPTLRAWERRYMILSPERAENDYRMYSERDIAIIRWLKDRVDSGMSISQAIALFRHLAEEHQQPPRKNSHSESTSPPRVMLSTSSFGEHKPIAEGVEQEVDEQMEKGASLSALQHAQKFDTEEILNTPPEMYNMPSVQERLLKAFNELDEATASKLMTSMLAIYPVEQVCTELITPTLWEIGHRWEQGFITVTIEHFASAFFHGLLTNLLHVTPISNMNTLVIACCAPGEVHELALLMLSLLLRRAGLRVAYLGQNIEPENLLQTIRQLSPALICVSVTLMPIVEAVIELGQKVQELPPPRPVFIFGGSVFEQHPDLIMQVPGVYIDGGMQTIITEIRRLAFQ